KRSRQSRRLVVRQTRAAGSGEPLVTKRCGGGGGSCPPQWGPARRSSRGFRATSLPVRESALRWFCARCPRRGCAAAWLSYRGRNRPPCVAACSRGVLIGKCGSMGRCSRSTGLKRRKPHGRYIGHLLDTEDLAQIKRLKLLTIT